MLTAWLKKLSPRSLYGRAALILIVPIVALQLVVSVAFIQRHFDRVTRQMTRNVLIELSYLHGAVAAAADARAAAEVVTALAEPLAFRAALPAPAPPGRDLVPAFDLSGAVVVAVLRDDLPTLAAADLASAENTVQLWLATPHGMLLVEFPRSRVSATNPHQLLVVMVFSGLLMTVIAVVFLRNQLRPIRVLARAAEAFGKGRIIAYRPRGAAEVRAAGEAFLDMRDRIERQIEQRTLFLSGVSHDLRTPLTRIKLALAMLDDAPEVEALREDVRAMEALLDSFLAFARADALDAPEPTDPAEVVGRIVRQARERQAEVALASDTGGAQVALRRVVFARAVENLLSNALRYGRRAAVAVTLDARQLRVTVEDDGPGIPEDRRAEAVRPFVRLDAARNQDRGPGVGLGLAIVQDAAQGHGGTLALDDSPTLGGLRATLTIPR